MALSKKQMSAVETIKGKTLALLLMRKQDAVTDFMLKKTVNEISSLIDSYELSDQYDLLERVENALMRVKRTGMASAFIRRHKKR